MRQRNDAHYHAQGQDLVSVMASTIADVGTLDLVVKHDDTKSHPELISSTESPSTSSPRSGSSSDAKTLQQPKQRKRSASTKSSASSTTRSPKAGRSKAGAKDAEEGRHHEPGSPASPTGSNHGGHSPNGAKCQREHGTTSSGKKKRCHCSSCQQDRTATSPSQRPYRYGKLLGSNDPMPIYAGPLGLGDDIPSPTPSPPASGRLTIHMAMSGHSPSSSPLMSMTRSSLPISTGTRGRSGRRNHHDGVPGMTSSHSLDGHDHSGNPSPTSTPSHPVIMGFHSQTHDPKARNGKKSPSRSTSQSFLDPGPLSPSPSSPSSPPYSSSSAASTFPLDSEIDTSPSLSPFLLSKRSFSPQRQISPLDLVPPGSPPMRADALHAYHILQLSTKTFRDNDSSSIIKRSPVSAPVLASNSDFPHLAPPVVLVQSPAMEPPVDPSDVSRILDQQQTEDHGPLLYSSVLASSTVITSSSSSAASSNFSQPSMSPSLLPYSPGSQRSTAATPPLSPSRKKEGHVPSLDKKGIIALPIA